MDVILSIKPKYAREILDGKKRYEFRKVIFHRTENLENVFIYCSSPVKKIIASFKIGDIIEATPDKLWSDCSGSAGIGKQEFFDYFADRDKGYAIEIEHLNRFNKPIDPREQIRDFRAPQSFCYFENEQGIGFQ